jgi:glycosyltransferase involved in cell wall biosynthesis
MEKLYDDPVLRQGFGENARARIATHFRNEDTVSKTLSLYQEILTG